MVIPFPYIYRGKARTDQWVLHEKKHDKCHELTPRMLPFH
jgi:hypothetical protein